MSRFQAFVIHFGISLVIFLFLAAVILTWWYPGIFFDIDGGWEGIRLIALVDLVLGPLLTFIVYRHGKPGLKMDLTLIGLFQAVCLSAGVWVVHNERPLAMVLVDDMFFSMSADDYLSVGIKPPDLSRFSERGPKWVTVELPEDVYESSDLRRAAVESEQPLRTLHEHYIPFDPMHLDIDAAISTEDLETLDKQTGGLRQWITDHGGKLEDYLFFEVGGRYSFVHLGFLKADMTPLGLLKTPAPA